MVSCNDIEERISGMMGTLETIDECIEEGLISCNNHAKLKERVKGLRKGIAEYMTELGCGVELKATEHDANGKTWYTYKEEICAGIPEESLLIADRAYELFTSLADLETDSHPVEMMINTLDLVRNLGSGDVVGVLEQMIECVSLDRENSFGVFKREAESIFPLFSGSYDSVQGLEEAKQQNSEIYIGSLRQYLSKMKELMVNASLRPRDSVEVQDDIRHPLMESRRGLFSFWTQAPIDPKSLSVIPAEEMAVYAMDGGVPSFEEKYGRPVSLKYKRATAKGAHERSFNLTFSDGRTARVIFPEATDVRTNEFMMHLCDSALGYAAGDPGFTQVTSKTLRNLQQGYLMDD